MVQDTWTWCPCKAFPSIIHRVHVTHVNTYMCGHFENVRLLDFVNEYERHTGFVTVEKGLTLRPVSMARMSDYWCQSHQYKDRDT